MSIYKPCDIRGHVPTDLAPELYRSWGRTLGEQLQPRTKFVVGGDERLSTPDFLAALVDGLCLAGVDVVELGMLPTPMIYYARHRLRATACAIVTASHNPPDFNGLKWMLGDRPPTEEEVHLLRRAAESPAPPPPGQPPSTPRAIDVTFDYVAWLQDYWATARKTRCYVALDPMCGSWAGRARRYLQAVFPEVIFYTIHDEPDAVFGGCCPDCSRPELLEELGELVYNQRTDLGIALDGDGDRVAFVDNQGTALTAEETTWILLESLGPALKEERFVYDRKFSDRIGEAAGRLGAEPVVTRSGHTFVRTSMLESDAIFGAEVSGHYFFGDLDGGDDGLFAACRMIAHLAQSQKTLADLRRECPPIFMTPDLRIPLAPRKQEETIAQVRAAWSHCPQNTVDGVRVDLPDGWALVRRSVTEPVLTFRFEAGSWARLEELVLRFSEASPGVGDQLCACYEAAMGASE